MTFYSFFFFLSFETVRLVNVAAVLEFTLVKNLRRDVSYGYHDLLSTGSQYNNKLSFMQYLFLSEKLPRRITNENKSG